MGTHIERRAGGVVVLTVDHPPVNALPVRGWQDLAAALRTSGADPETRAVVLQAAGRGFNAGVDIKELAADSGHAKLVAVNQGCYDAFKAVYECPVPVISAVHGFCLGGGIGLVGNSDIIIAAEDATFGLPEVDRGALGAATHLSRLVPQHTMRAMFYTGRTVTAQQLLHFGSVWQVVPREELADAASRLAEEIAAKDPLVVRKAKESLNGIDPIDVNRSYRFEQGFTFELNLTGVSDRARAEFVHNGQAEGD
ncbi:enoyl-CoA hydratase family protein [Saccharopolyspora sp. K220]|uniref:enoyl-CoA hydratase family protein n=1 Tax=Saccharopolyspora soli TaxID=2926618 RepID=UPI001F57ACE1|nr:enoyl-CoA hydratase family protein [Saccharopolyspora soli]MCI2418107.1 enoyl-CoA hydratase family protein [Saccharopolyspora soli]